MYGELLDESTVQFERRLPGPIERVWQYLVESDKREKWLCAGGTVLEVGGKVDMHFDNKSLSTRADIEPPEKYRDIPEKVSFSGEVLRCEVPRLLEHTWDVEGVTSQVCYELADAGDEVKLVLTHRGLISPDEIMSVCAGWHTHFAILAAVLDGGEPPPFWKTHTALEERYKKRFCF